MWLHADEDVLGLVTEKMPVAAVAVATRAGRQAREGGEEAPRPEPEAELAHA